MKKQSQILISLFAGIFLLTGCQGQAPASQSVSAAASSTVSEPPAPSSSVAVSSSTPEPAQEWGTAGVGDTVTVAGRELTLTSWGVSDGQIEIAFSAPPGEGEAAQEFHDWSAFITESYPGAEEFGSTPYRLVIEAADGSCTDAIPDSFMSGSIMYFWFTYEALPTEPVFHLMFADKTGVVPGFTFS